VLLPFLIQDLKGTLGHRRDGSIDAKRMSKLELGTEWILFFTALNASYLIGRFLVPPTGGMAGMTLVLFIGLPWMLFKHFKALR
jgi:hypothetical protein